MASKLRRLIELPGVAPLEFKAVMKREFAEPQARAEHPELDEVSTKIFGLTADAAEATPLPADWDNIETKTVAVQVEAFEAAGWDVTDDKRRPLRTFGHWNQQLWLAIRGVAGTLPFQPEQDDSPAKDWGAALAADAKRFKKR